MLYKISYILVCVLNAKVGQKMRGLYLAVSLRGQAQGVFVNIGKSNDYKELVKALEERFAPPNQAELYRAQLRARRQKASETVTEMHDIHRLTNQ